MTSRIVLVPFTRSTVDQFNRKWSRPLRIKFNVGILNPNEVDMQMEYCDNHEDVFAAEIIKQTMRAVDTQWRAGVTPNLMRVDSPSIIKAARGA